MKSAFNPFPFLRIVLCFIAGIVFQHYWDSISIVPWYILALSTGIYILTFIPLVQKIYHRVLPYFRVVCVCFCLFSFGILYYQIRDDQKSSVFLTKVLQENKVDFKKLNDEKNVYYLCRLISFPDTQKNKLNAQAELISLKLNKKWVTVCGKIILSIVDSFTSQKYSYGDYLIINGLPEPLPGKKITIGFNYFDYLRLQSIHFRHRVKVGGVLFTGKNDGNRITYFSNYLKEIARNQLKKYLTDKNAYSVASSLLLGDKSSISTEVKELYTDTGTMHVLAVSGLHVAIVYLMLLWLLKPFDRFRFGKWFKYLLLLCILWIYAFITGFSASVVRSVIMFSCFLMAEALNKKTNTFNTISVSLFIVLLINPKWLLDTGCQLSFLAVSSIVFYQPYISRLFHFENKIANYSWQLTSVSLAAQLGTLPITLYYFHQYPVYSLLSNLIIIPGSTLILYAGYGFLGISYFSTIADYGGMVLNAMIYYTNQILHLIENLPNTLIKSIYFDFWLCILGYLCLLFLTAFLLNKKYHHFLIFWMLLVFSLFYYERDCSKKNNTDFIAISSNLGKTGIFTKSYDKMTLINTSRDSINKKMLDFYQPIAMNFHKNNIGHSYLSQEPNSDSFYLSRVIQIKNKTILVVDSNLLERTLTKINFRFDYVILCGLKYNRKSFNNLDNITGLKFILTPDIFGGIKKKVMRYCNSKNIPLLEINKVSGWMEYI